MVAIIFPFTFIASKFLCRTVWFFRRGNNNLPQFHKFNSIMFYKDFLNGSITILVKQFGLIWFCTPRDTA